MKIENLRATVRHVVLSSLIFVLFLTAAGCNGGYGTPSGGGSLPSIASVSPTSGQVGTSVTIYGTNFGASQGTSTVKFNGTSATPTNWSATSIMAPVPAGAMTGNIVVTIGGVASNGMAFTVNTTSAPSITTQPASQTVTVGQTATFSVSATGTAPLIYQWKKGGLAITNATSASYSTPATTTSDNGSQFTVVVSNSVGSVTSNAATLMVTTATAPSISNLSPSSGAVGTPVTITGTNFGATQGSSTVKFGTTTAMPTSWSATSIVAPVPAGTATGSVSVVVTVGSVTSNAATLMVTAASVAPSITTQPASQTVTAGQTATFSVVASGTAPLSYQWQKNGANIAGATSSSYTTPATTTFDSGSTFDVVVSNTAGTATSNPATLTVNPSSGSKFPIKLSANKRYFVDQNGTPWLMVMDAAHHIMPVIGSTSSSIMTYINSRVAQGFTAINIYGACAGTGTCPNSGAAQNGQFPFTVGSSNSTYDLSTPNPLYWSQVDALITAANNAALVVLFDPLPWNVDFGTAMENVTGPINYRNDQNPPTDSNDYNFGVYLGNRYKSFPNIIWQFGQDFRHGGGLVNGQWVPADQNFMDYMSQVIAGVASVDTNHLITTQMNYYNSYTQQGYQTPCNANCTTGVYWNPRFGNANNVSFVYTYYETYDEMLQAYNCGPSGPCTIQANDGTRSIGGHAGNAPSTQLPPSVMPTFLGEANYEGANNTGFLSSNANAFITRQQMWYPMTSGAAGFEFGMVNVNHFDSSPLWSNQLNTTATQQVKYVNNLLKNYNWWTFVPDTTHQVVTNGYGTPNPGNGNLYNATYATTTWDGSSTAIVYTPVSTTLIVNMAKFSASSVTATWYDPTTGTSTVIGSFPNIGSQNFTTPPGTHTDGTGANDWVLVLH